MQATTVTDKMIYYFERILAPHSNKHWPVIFAKGSGGSFA